MRPPSSRRAHASTWASPVSHLGYARAALDAGRSAFRETWLAIDLSGARAFLAAAGGSGAVSFQFAASLGMAANARCIAEEAVGMPRRLTIEVGLASCARSWQADAAAWLDARAEGGFLREVVFHFLFLSRRLLGPPI